MLLKKFQNVPSKILKSVINDIVQQSWKSLSLNQLKIFYNLFAECTVELPRKKPLSDFRIFIPFVSYVVQLIIGCYFSTPTYKNRLC